MIKNAKAVKAANEFLKIMVVGDFGTGKSVFGSTFPTPGHVFDIDKHILIYRGLDFDYSQYSLTSKGWVEFEKDLISVGKKVEAGEIKTVIVDSTTSLTDLAMERALQLDPKRNPSTQGPLWNVHYQIVKNLVEGKLRRLISLNCNLLINSHWKIVTDNETGAIISCEPMLTGMLAAIIPGYFDEVYYAFTKMKAGKPQYYLRTLPRGFYKARSCFSGKAQILPAEIPNDYNVLLGYMNNEGGE